MSRGTTWALLQGFLRLNGSKHCRSRWLRGGVLVAALLLAIAVAGCGSSGRSGAAASTAAPTTTPGTGPIGGNELPSLPRVPPATSPGPTPSTNAPTVDRSFLQAVFNDAQRLWSDEFRTAGHTYSPARLVIFSGSVHSGCGTHGNVGPFYCGADGTIYLDASFLTLLARQPGLGGFAQAYVIGHEFGHHVQHLLGIAHRVAAANQANPAGENARSVRVELQADCLAGVWAHSAYTRGQLTASDLEAKLRTAALIGDDFQARAAGRPVDPGLFTHGSSADRQRWLRTGFDSGKPGACDTFAGR